MRMTSGMMWRWCVVWGGGEVQLTSDGGPPWQPVGEDLVCDDLHDNQRGHSMAERRMMKLFGYVFVGAGIGGVARYAMSTFLDDRLAPTFPLAKFLINVIGSFVLGVIMRLALHGDAMSVEMRA